MYFMWTKSGQICVWPKCVIGHTKGWCGTVRCL